MTIIVKHTKVSTVPDTTDTDLVRPSDWNADHTLTGLGTMAEQNANNVAITGGSISGTTVSGYIPTSEKGAALGVATLDAGGLVPQSQIPMQGDLNYQGTWNATTNTPTLVSSTGTKGYYYVVDVAGTTNLDGITDWQIGDWAIFNGTVWQKVDNTDAVTSVNGQVGTVVLTTTNIAEGTNEYFTTARARTSISAGTGISYDNGTGVVTNSAPDQTVSLTDGTGIDVTGTYPNFTVTNTAPDQTVSIASGTGISTSGTYPSFTVTNTAPDQVVSLTQGGTTTITGTYPNFTISSDDQFDGTVTSVGGTGTVNGLTLTGTVTSSGNLTLGGTLNLAAPPAIGGFIPNEGHFTNLSATGTVAFDGAQGTSGQVLTSNGAGLTPKWSTPTVGTVTSVTGTAPVVSSGGATPAISMAAATGSVNGYLTSTDWTTFNNKGSGTVTSVAATAGTGISVSGSPITSSGTLNITNTAPDQVVSIASGTGISVTGTYPSFTVTNTSPDVPFTYTNTYVPYGQGTTTPDQSADFTYNETLKTVSAPQVQASNGIFVNSATVTASYSIPSGSNAMSAGTISIANGITVTVPNGNTWVIV